MNEAADEEEAAKAEAFEPMRRVIAQTVVYRIPDDDYPEIYSGYETLTITRRD